MQTKTSGAAEREWVVTGLQNEPCDGLPPPDLACGDWIIELRGIVEEVRPDLTHSLWVIPPGLDSDPPMTGRTFMVRRLPLVGMQVQCWLDAAQVELARLYSDLGLLEAGDYFKPSHLFDQPLTRWRIALMGPEQLEAFRVVLGPEPARESPQHLAHFTPVVSTVVELEFGPLLYRTTAQVLTTRSTAPPFRASRPLIVSGWLSTRAETFTSVFVSAERLAWWRAHQLPCTSPPTWPAPRSTLRPAQ